MGQSRPLIIFYFRSFLVPTIISIIQIEKSVDGVLGIRTRGLRMVGNDATTELWRHPQWIILLFLKNIWSSSQKRHFSSDLVPINVHFHQFSCWQCHFTSDLTSYRKSHLTSDLVPLKRYFLVSSWKCYFSLNLLPDNLLFIRSVPDNFLFIRSSSWYFPFR